MALPISVPYSFANATTSIPLSQLDTDISTIYATVNGIGNGTVALSNVVITGGIISNVSGISSSSISNGTSNVSISTANGSVVVSTANNTAMTVDTSQNMTAVGTVAMASSFKRNRIINGNMLIDQRNAGASVTPNNSFTLDRWAGFNSQTSKYTVQQNSGSVTGPTSFTNYLGVVSSSAYSVVAGDYFGISQTIEGFNTADLGYGTANAQTVTISFWVRSSLTGTFSVSVRNYGTYNRSYPATYTISAANTWEYKTITIAGDTTGTWTGATNSGSLLVSWSIGCGSTYSGTANAWQAGNIIQATGSTSVVGTNGATFYLTGVQLEVGTKATPYEMQIYSDQLAQCQRYYFSTVSPITSAGSVGTVAALSYSTSGLNCRFISLVAMRTAPTAAIYNNSTVNQLRRTDTGTTVNVTIAGYASWGNMGYGYVAFTGTPLAGAGISYDFDYSLNAEL